MIQSVSTTELQAYLRTQHDAEIVNTREFTFPLHTVNVSYNPIVKTPMDILMKMMLKSFHRAPIKATDVLANILLVEPLFIEDLTKKMLASHLIEKDEEGIYCLTDIGHSQLAAGVYEEQLDLVTEEIFYSTIHEAMLSGDIEPILEIEELPEPLSYAEEKLESLDEKNVILQLQERLDQSIDFDSTDDEAANAQAFITSLQSYEAIQIQDIPCLLFILKDKKDDRLFARVYNMFTLQWDTALETFIQDHERTSWQSELI